MRRSWFLLLAIFTTFLIVLPVSAADRILFNYGPLGFSISVEALATFAQEGRIEKELAFFLNRLSPQQQERVRNFLRSRYQVNPMVIYRLSHSAVGERLLKDVGELINIPKNQNGFYGLRGSLIQAVLKSKSINAIELMRKFPTDIELNTENIMEFVREMSTMVDKTQTLVAELDRMTSEQAKTESSIDLKQLRDIKTLGQFSTSRQTIELYDSQRGRKLIVDLYLPETSQQKQFPIIVVSNGIGAKRDRFDDLAYHLASYGFAVAIPDHPGSSSQRQREFYKGLYKDNFDAMEFRDRPLDVTFLLNELEKRNQSEYQDRLNLQQVGLFGYSFGGATALSLAGAELDFEQLERDCHSQTRLLNISLYYQCRALEIPKQPLNLQDSRIKAIYLFVPFSKSLFGQAGMSRVTTPVMWQAAAEDIITPLVSEQMPAFDELVAADKYLSVSTGLPHAWVLLPLMQGLTNQEISKQEAAAIARDYQNILALSFFKVYLDRDEQYRSYLQASYIKTLSQDPYNLSLVQSVPSLARQRFKSLPYM
ncbi:putative dienelactone hydrolase [Pleurocapsa sp. PCC 7327]|uniref:alpha/beta hydrolase n=1 Tax=Pleurocapsa sp. PCC 7327 TaxID=118163 RepID=UPI00029FC982|nr:alpha/beta hydrolase [Pleurocapsa sp. PCC 7327]AFY78522.1 putative dienelactone hydrolase [Pleurocapsa sp. PCC 7327]